MKIIFGMSQGVQSAKISTRIGASIFHAINIKTGHFSEILVLIYEFTRSHVPED
jgi:hypothetical protein